MYGFILVIVEGPVKMTNASNSEASRDAALSDILSGSVRGWFEGVMSPVAAMMQPESTMTGKLLEVKDAEVALSDP